MKKSLSLKVILRYNICKIWKSLLRQIPGDSWRWSKVGLRISQISWMTKSYALSLDVIHYNLNIIIYMGINSKSMTRRRYQRTTSKTLIISTETWFISALFLMNFP